ncbi:MAG: toxin-antitoxin system protein [Clostridia bacterium]|nr:toxin-antitoxin system protein [Clostridia bacterium]
MKPLKDHVSLTLDNDLLEKLRENADIEDRSLSQYINLILKQYLANMNSD